MSTEEWRDIPGWEGYYQASSEGRVRSLDRWVDNGNGGHIRPGTVLKSAKTGKQDHQGVALCRDARYKTFRVHQLVMWAFVGPQEDGIDVCHWDGNPANNALSNLRYGTRADNAADKLRHGNDVNTNKTHCPRGHELNEWNCTDSGLRQGRRDCRSCGNAKARMRYHGIDIEHLQSYSDSYYEKYKKENN